MQPNIKAPHCSLHVGRFTTEHEVVDHIVAMKYLDWQNWTGRGTNVPNPNIHAWCLQVLQRHSVIGSVIDLSVFTYLTWDNRFILLLDEVGAISLIKHEPTVQEGLLVGLELPCNWSRIHLVRCNIFYVWLHPLFSSSISWWGRTICSNMNYAAAWYSVHCLQITRMGY